MCVSISRWSNLYHLQSHDGLTYMFSISQRSNEYVFQSQDGLTYVCEIGSTHKLDNLEIEAHIS
jgi:hypothetical protein